MFFYYFCKMIHLQKILHTFTLLLVTVLCVGCSGVKPAAQAYTAAQPKLSATTRMLIHDMEQDMQVQHSTWSTYTPSADIIDLYGLQMIDNTYHVRGFITTCKGADLSSIIGNKGYVRTAKDTLYTVSISVNIIPNILNNNAIQYIDISIPTHPNTSAPLPDNTLKVN